MKSIPLTQGKVALVDDEDYLALSKYRWFAYKGRTTYYVARVSPTDPITHKRSFIQMHSMLLNTPSDMETDHINGNGLDNRRKNLRVVTCRQNGQNRHQIKSSKYPGVSWHKQNQKWTTRIRFNGKKRYLGSYTDEQTAATVYSVACEALGV